ncbi:MAG: hypothetical protein KGZ81_07335 [Flavobacteriales bacterium]|nr:hypothetical protein [Flavobacteriales bacterium]
MTQEILPLEETQSYQLQPAAQVTREMIGTEPYYPQAQSDLVDYSLPILAILIIIFVLMIVALVKIISLGRD